MNSNVNDRVASIDWDTKEFGEALHLYAELSKKGFAEALQKKGGDVFFRASRAAPRASAAIIRAKYTPKYIAAILRKKKGGNKEHVVGRRVSKKHRDKKTKTYTYHGGNVYHYSYYRQWSRAEAVRLYKALRKRAGRAVGFIRAFLSSMAMVIRGKGPLVGVSYQADGMSQNGKGQGVRTSLEYRMTDHGLEASFSGVYAYRRRKGDFVKFADQVLEDAVVKGMAEVKADMVEYIERKLSEAGVRVSA